MNKIALQRLYSQQLEQARFTRPAEVVAWLGGMQAQDYAGAKWSIGLRLPDSHDRDIESALADKSIVRTWAMRGTLQFVSAADLRWILALLAPQIITHNARRYRELELDEPTMQRSNHALMDALQGGKQLNRTALKAVLEENGISTTGQRAPYLLQRASLEGLICQGTMQRNDPTYIALEESIPPGKNLASDEALAELALRYFCSRGPATLQDFGWWSGLSIETCKIGLEAVRKYLIQEKIENRQYWLSPDYSSEPMQQLTAHLLAGYDEYLIGYRDRSAVLEGQHAKALDRGNGYFASFIINGQVKGTWRRTLKQGKVMIESLPFTSLSIIEERAFLAACEQFGDFLDLAVVNISS